MQLVVKIVSQAAQTKICGFYNNMLKIHLKGVPEKGRLNNDLIDLIAEGVAIPKSAIIIKQGLTSPVKRLEIDDQYALKLELFLSKFKAPDDFLGD